MDATESGDRDEIEAFDRYHGRDGCLARYARHRPARFAMRQIIPAAGFVALWALVAPGVALLAMGVLLLGEAVEGLYLRHLLKANPDWRFAPRHYLGSAVAAGVQASTVAVWVAIVWCAVPGAGGRFFAMAFLSAAVLDAGFSLKHHPTATKARLAIYGALAVGLFAAAALAAGDTASQLVFDALAAAILAYVLVVFIRFSTRAFKRRVAFERALLTETREVARANADLAERAEAARQLALVAEHANDAIMLTDPEDRIVWVNEAFAQVIGHTAAEIAGRRPQEVLSGPNTDPETVEAIARARRDRAPLRAEIVARTKDGADLWMEINNTPVFETDGALRYFVNVGRDISQAKAREAELATARAAAEKAAHAKSVFLATMSHEIRTPLNGILGMASLMTEQDLPAEAREHAEIILQSGEGLLEIIGDVLEISRLEAGGVALAAEPFDPGEAIAAAVRLFRPKADEKGLSLTLTDTGELPARVTGDAGRLRQILVNLVGNALKFTVEGGVEIRATASGETLTVRVTDTGPGIDAAKCEHVFAAFAQESVGIGGTHGGTGLGLSISRMLAREMGGDVVAIPRPGPGACFEAHVSLPPAPTEATAEAPAPAPPAPVAGRLAGARILAAEDNATNRLLIEKFLAATGADLRFAADGSAALDLFDSFAPDAVLMDVAMPVMDGLAATRAIRARADGGAPIIGLTANAFEEDRDRCLGAGMSDFLAKPIQRATLVARLEAAIAPAPALPAARPA